MTTYNTEIPYCCPYTGIVAGVHWCHSPNFNQRPESCRIDAVIIHAISLPPGQFGGQGVHQLFTNCLNPIEHPFYQGIANLTVSAHLLIDRHGEITQFVPLTLRAWHAGVSEFNGQNNVNDFSIGIELEGDDHTPFTDRQYQQLDVLLFGIQKAFPLITPDRITGHSDIAPGRKTDPGPFFDWQRLRNPSR